MPIETAVSINLRGTLGGQTCENLFYYFSEDTLTTVPSSAVAEAGKVLLWDSLKTLLTNEFRMLEVIGQIGTFTPPILKPAYTVSVDEGGDITASETLPGYCTVVVQLIPDQTDLRPVDGRVPGLGWRGISGVPEAAQNNGLLTDAAITDWRAWAESIEVLEVSFGGTDYEFRLGNYSAGGTWGDPPTSHPPVWSYVAETDITQAMGTRRSRRR